MAQVTDNSPALSPRDPAAPVVWTTYATAQNYANGGIDLNAHLIKDTTSTFVLRVSGNSMAGAGISDGDEVIVDRALPPRNGSVIVAVIDGELTIKRLRTAGGRVRLQSEETSPTDVSVGSLSELNIWGVVTRCLHHV